MNKPGFLTVVRDTALFALGVVLVLKQAGILFEPPKNGPELELILLGALFCNGPLVLQFLSIRFGAGTSSPPPSPPQSLPESQSEPSSAP